MILEGDSSPERAIYTRDVLQQSLPSINCEWTDTIYIAICMSPGLSLQGSPMDCLQILTQRVQMPGRGTQLGSSGLQSTQAAILCLFYAAYTHDDL